jgi:hypothetical protein
MAYRFKSNLKWQDAPIWLRVVWIGAIANFVIFWSVAVWCGGDALNGKIVAGHYFVGSHGRYTEVTKAFFDYSRLHALSATITMPLAMLCAFGVMGRHPGTIEIRR